MEDSELINLWKSHNKTLNENLVFNKKNAEEITRMKIRSVIESIRPVKLIAIITGIFWVGFIDTLIVDLFDRANIYFIISAAGQSLLSTICIAVYVYHLVLIQQVAIDDSVLATQEKIARLKSSTLWVARIAFLQLPLWTTFYWNERMFEHANTGMIVLQVFVTVSFTLLSVWLLLNIKYENRHKKWFRLIFNGPEWKPIIKALDILNQIDEYRN